MKRETDIEDLKSKIIPILERHGIKKAGLFGSLIHGQLKKRSDIDILVQIPDDVSLLGFIGIKLELEESLKRKVDLIEYETIKPPIKDRIINEQMIIL